MGAFTSAILAPDPKGTILWSTAEGPSITVTYAKTPAGEDFGYAQDFPRGLHPIPSTHSELQE